MIFRSLDPQDLVFQKIRCRGDGARIDLLDGVSGPSYCRDPKRLAVMTSALKNALEMLSLENQEILRLRAEEKSFRDIAIIIGCHASTVLRRYRRAEWQVRVMILSHLIVFHLKRDNGCTISPITLDSVGTGENKYAVSLAANKRTISGYPTTDEIANWLRAEWGAFESAIEVNDEGVELAVPYIGASFKKRFKITELEVAVIVPQDRCLAMDLAKRENQEFIYWFLTGKDIAVN